MPTSKFQRVVFAFLTVTITVHLFVFYNLAISMGGMSNEVFKASRGIVGIEFVFAFLLEVFIVGSLAEKLAFKVVNPAEEKPYIITTAIICATVGLMCPMMSFIATILYNGINIEFLANWMQKIVINFPFALLSQLFFIQPFVRFLFGTIFKKQGENKENQYVPESMEFE
ncbi:DUF2798 domain-containing protein [Acetivibrio cellulolyticus]|uniref:DUF2798 domain-containing protein n=1 Tax=Acetivibrio cellulolyticus TaxID=35830 RepID=UPI0001E2FBAE|nr:DUF2798 domain-containing protein [Acetivibrio cellulolyticus]